MSLQGDLSTLDLAGLFQNLEAARKSGLLSIGDVSTENGEGQTQLYFREGRLALIAYPNRPSLLEFLVASGAIRATELEAAKKRRRRGQPLCDVLIETKALSRERLLALATARLTDEACELLAAGVGRFQFTNVDIPRGVFDPEERALGLGFAAGPLLLEAARRADHWRLIRERVPSDSTHFVLARPPRQVSESLAELFAAMSKLLDGTRSVGEVVAHFPHRRFDAYQLLADLVESQSLRLAASTDLNRMVQELARYDKKRAWALLARGLETNPQHIDLLCTKVLLAEKLGDLEQASEALKLVVHQHLETGKAGEAREWLARLKKLDVHDPFVWEKSFDLAVQEGRKADAILDARKLVGLYRKRGLHKKVCGILERLIELQGATWDLVRELARARVDGGEPETGVKILEKFGSAKLASESYPLARKVYEEILVLDPGSKKAKETLQDIKSGEHARRRAYWRRMRVRVIVGLLLLVLLPWISYEALARRAYVEATRTIVREGWLEAGRYAEAIQSYEQVLESYRFATISLFEVERMLDALEARQNRSSAQE